MTTMSDFDWINCEEDQSMDLSFPATFAEIFSAELTECFKNSFSEIAEIWRLIGFPAIKRDEKIEEIREIIINEIEKTVNKEKKFLEECRSYSIYKLNEINKVLADLTMPLFVIPESCQTLISQNKILQEKYREVIEIKNDRMDKLERIESKLRKICQMLGSNYEPTTFATNIPNELELKSLALILKNQERTLQDRRLQYDSLKSIINKFRFELEFEPENDDEKMILESNKDEFIFSQDNMAKLISLHNILIQLYNDSKARIEKLTSTLIQLFNRLDVPDDERSAFFASVQGTYPKQEQIILDEIAKYEIIKKNSIEKIIKNIRNEISILSEKCMINKFDEYLMDSEEFTETLLTKLENEFEKMKRFDENYQQVFMKFREYEESLERLIELEKKSMDPNRFANRGGTLLQNERDRKMLLKKLPKIEKEIRTIIANADENSDSIPFDSYGFNVDLYFQTNQNRLNICKNEYSKGSFKTNKSNSSGSAKKLVSSTHKNRIPFSPRNKEINNDCLSAGKLKRNLESDMKTAYDLMERHFQRDLQKDDLHSTMIDSENKMPMDYNCPLNSGGLTYRSGMRRRSKSFDDLNVKSRIKINKVQTHGTASKLVIETIARRPPFMP
ncbi:Protein regulator of cytokinesis 1 [Sarcoptes scabiei]|uniref:Protein regulator of cytokinesis 1 n=1 Tax=Sarcoptes scabiei TaxID=52283 RepID=A0A834R4B8_SARSC|nr:Protein regulator of cytokinesis 1 [Sarcoptes scabiei]